jgi:hypothetical protein
MHRKEIMECTSSSIDCRSQRIVSLLLEKKAIVIPLRREDNKTDMIAVGNW